MSNKNDRWSALSLKDRADLMNMYITNGISDLKEMKKHYNSFSGEEDILYYDDNYIEPAVVTASRESSLADKIFNYELSKAIFEENKKDNKKDKNTLKEDNKPKSVLGIDRFIHNPIIKEDISRLYNNLDTNKIRINNIFSGEENQNNEKVLYYDDTDIEPARLVAASSKTLDFFDDFSSRYQKYHGKDINEYVRNVVKNTDAVVDTSLRDEGKGGYYSAHNDKIVLQNSIFPEVFTHELTHKLNDNWHFFEKT